MLRQIHCPHHNTCTYISSQPSTKQRAGLCAGTSLPSPDLVAVSDQAFAAEADLASAPPPSHQHHDVAVGGRTTGRAAETSCDELGMVLKATPVTATTTPVPSANVICRRAQSSLRAQQCTSHVQTLSAALRHDWLDASATTALVCSPNPVKCAVSHSPHCLCLCSAPVNLCSRRTRPLTVLRLSHSAPTVLQLCHTCAVHPCTQYQAVEGLGRQHTATATFAHSALTPSAVMLGPKQLVCRASSSAMPCEVLV